MMSRAEVTTRYAKVYAKASKKDKGRILGEVVGGDPVVAGQRPPPTYRGREAAARWRQTGVGRRVSADGSRRSRGNHARRSTPTTP